MTFMHISISLLYIIGHLSTSSSMLPAAAPSIPSSLDGTVRAPSCLHDACVTDAQRLGRVFPPFCIVSALSMIVYQNWCAFKLQFCVSSSSGPYPFHKNLIIFSYKIVGCRNHATLPLLLLWSALCGPQEVVILTNLFFPASQALWSLAKVLCDFCVDPRFRPIFLARGVYLRVSCQRYWKCVCSCSWPKAGITRLLSRIEADNTYSSLDMTMLLAVLVIAQVQLLFIFRIWKREWYFNGMFYLILISLISKQ